MIGSPAEDGVPERLQFRLDERTLLALIPTADLDGHAWQITAELPATS